MNMGDQYDVPEVHALLDSLSRQKELLEDAQNSIAAWLIVSNDYAKALAQIASYSPRGSLNANGPIPVGALSRDIEAMQRIARRALVGWSDAA